MDNNEIIQMLGVGLAASSLAIVFSATLNPRPNWLVPLLAIVGAVLGLLAFLLVLTR